MNKIRILTFNETARYMGYPDEVKCPCCHKISNPKKISGHLDTNNQATIFLYCRLCQNSFSLVFNNQVISLSNDEVGGYTKEHSISSAYPIIVNKTTFPESINALSSDFVELFNQASVSEQYNCDKIAGAGYRKALEFLIKDYSISQLDEQSNIDQVKKMALNQCIENYIDHPRIKSIAKRAAWLGNDETHYERKYSNVDIKTFKTLIHLAVTWISLDIESKELEDIIPHPSQL